MYFVFTYCINNAKSKARIALQKLSGITPEACPLWKVPCWNAKTPQNWVWNLFRIIKFNRKSQDKTRKMSCSPQHTTKQFFSWILYPLSSLTKFCRIIDYVLFSGIGMLAKIRMQNIITNGRLERNRTSYLGITKDIKKMYNIPLLIIWA